MYIFNEKRENTPLTEEEREWIQAEIEDSKAKLQDADWLEQDCQSWREICGTWQVEWSREAMEVDIAGMERCLIHNKIITW